MRPDRFVPLLVGTNAGLSPKECRCRRGERIWIHISLCLITVSVLLGQSNNLFALMIGIYHDDSVGVGLMSCTTSFQQSSGARGLALHWCLLIKTVGTSSELLSTVP